MTTVSELVEATRSRLVGGLIGAVAVLGSPHTVGDGKLTLTAGQRAGTLGGVVSVGLSTYVIVGSSTDGTILNVVPGADGSPDTAAPAGSLVRVSPVVTTWACFRELAREIKTLASPANGLYGVAAVDSAVDVRTNAYYPPDAWTVDPIRVLAVRIEQPGSDRAWRDIDGWDYQAETGAVQIWGHQGYGTIRVVYALPFAEPHALTDTLEDLGVPEEIQDIPILGALMSLVTSIEGRRNNPAASGDGRIAKEVIVGGSANLAQLYAKQRTDRIREEMTRLNRLYPYRMQFQGDRTEVGPSGF